MNIKIKHFQKKTSYSNSGKNKLLAALGLMASLGIAGCETTSTSGDPVMPETLSSAEVPESSSSAELINLEPIHIYTDPPMSGIIEVYRFESSSSVSSSSSEEPPLAGGVQIIDSSSSTDSPKAGIVEIPESSSSTNASLDDESLIL